MNDLRLHAPNGASMNLDTLIRDFKRRGEKSHAVWEAQNRILEGTSFKDTKALQRAVAEVGIEIGREMAFKDAAMILEAVKTKLTTS